MSATGFEFGVSKVLIARLIADAERLATQLSDLGAALGGAGVSPLALNGVQMVVPHDDAAQLRTGLDSYFPESDWLIGKDEIRIPNVFVSDMDSTMIGQECIDELADYAGLKDKIADITERAMQGELDFEDALKERVTLLKGLPEDAIEQCLAERIRANPGARTLVQTLKSKGCKTVLVTGGFHHFADRVGEELGFDLVVGNRLEVANGKLTGQLEGAIVDSTTKRQVLEQEAGVLDTRPWTLAIGDGANDIPMIEAATYGFAYHAKPKAKAASDGVIDKGDLTGVLSLLGISENEWVRD
ncbi:MAG: phosphoserine phosphatase SerB [Pseudomonadota bacterium]